MASQQQESDAAAASGDEEVERVAPGEATVLVSEFPPPPYYYKHAADLKPPEIPVDALSRGTRRAAAAAARARAAEHRQRLTDTGEIDDKTGAILGGVKEDDAEEEGDVVAVFGEIIEDPWLVEPLDHCENPRVVQDQVKFLNRSVVQGFVHLVQDLVHRPIENKYVFVSSRALKYSDFRACKLVATAYSISLYYLQKNPRRAFPQHLSHAAGMQ